MNTNALCFIDWLSVTYTLTDKSLNEINGLILNEVQGYITEKVEGTNTFSTRYLVYNEVGVKKLTILADPISSLISKDVAHIQFANNTLYSGEFVFLIQNLQLFHSGYIHSISRIDICCDFQVCLDENKEYMEPKELAIKLLTDKYYIAGKQNGSAFFEYEKDEDTDLIAKIPKQISWGHKTSQFKWKMYNKTKEIQEESHKDYLLNIYKTNGFDKDKDVWRIECSITKCSNIQMKDKNGTNYLSVSNIIKQDNISKLFLLLQKRSFNVKVNDGNVNSSRNRNVDIFNNKADTLIVEKIYTDNSTIRNSIKSYIRSINTMLNDVVVQHKLGLIENLCESLKKVVTEFDLDEYFEKVQGESCESFVKNTLEISKNLFKNSNILNKKNHELQCKIEFK